MSFLDNLIERFVKINRRMKKWQRLVSVLSAVIVFITTYTLILPAITLDKDTAQQQPGIEVAASEANAEERGAAVAEGGMEEGSAGEEAADPQQTIIEEEPVNSDGDDRPADSGSEAQSGESLSDGEPEYVEDKEPKENTDEGSGDVEDERTEDSGEGEAQSDEENEAVTEVNNGSDDDNSGAGDDNAADGGSTAEVAAAGVTETVSDDIPATGVLSADDLAAAIVAGEIPLITEKTQLVYEYIDEEYEKNKDKNKEENKEQEAGESSDEKKEDVDDGYFVYAEFDGSAKLPEGVELQVKEITKESDPDLYAMYCEKTLSEVQDKYDENTGITFAKFYDISFVYQGTAIEPSGDVKIRIEYKREIEVKKDEKVNAIHFDKEADEKPEVIESEVNPDDKEKERKEEREKDGKSESDDTEAEPMKAVEFTSDRFSVYGVVGTGSITTTFLSADGKTYEVTVNCDTDANIPAGSELVVSEVEESADKYEDYLASAAEAMEVSADKIAYAKLLDISIMKDGKEITPETPVDVQIKLLDKESFDENESLNVIHYESGDENPVLVNGSEQDGVVSFEAEGFSVYGVFYTVDFHWAVDGKEYEFSIPGGGFISFTKLVEALGISDLAAKFVSDIEDIDFSGPDLIWVGRIEEESTVAQIKEANGIESQYSADLREEDIAEINAQTVEAGDWALISLQPFSTSENLIITMSDGQVFTIVVTDDMLDPSTIDRDAEYITYIYTRVGDNDYYVLKNDGTTVPFSGNPSDLETLGNEYKWTITYSYTENVYSGRFDSGYRYYHIRPYSDPSMSLNVKEENLSGLSVTGGNSETFIIDHTYINWAGNGSIISYDDVAGAYAIGSNFSQQYDFGMGTFTWMRPSEVRITDDGVLYSHRATNLYEATSHFAPIWFYTPAETAYEFTVKTDNAIMGTVAGLGKPLNDNETNDYYYEDAEEFTTRTIYNAGSTKSNAFEIRAVANNEDPSNPKYLFSHWELDGEPLNGVGDTIAAHTLPIKKDGAELVAVFQPNLRYLPTDEELLGRNAISEDEFYEWLESVKQGQNPLVDDACKKTAEVVDYENRIYRVDLTAASKLSTFDGIIDMAFIADVSASMKFPSKLKPCKAVYGTTTDGDYITIPKGQEDAYKKDLTTINDNWDDWGLEKNSNKKYYVIGDEENTSTVCVLWWNGSSWRMRDASKVSGNDEFNAANGSHATYYANADQKKLIIYESADNITGRETGTLAAVLTKLRNDSNYGVSLNVGDPIPRAAYLEASIRDSITEMYRIKQELTLSSGGNLENDYWPKVAYNLFCGNMKNPNTGTTAATNSHYFALPPSDGDLGISYSYAGGTSTDLALLDAAGYRRSDMNGNEYTGTNSSRWKKLQSEHSGYSYTKDTSKTIGFQWEPTSTARYAILITDGAPQRSSQNIYQEFITEAKDLFTDSSKDANGKPATLVSVGLSLDNVDYGKRMLYNISDIDELGDPYYYRAESGDGLIQVIYETLQKTVANMIVTGKVTDTIGQSFYPVDENGNALQNGDRITLNGEKIPRAQWSNYKEYEYGVIKVTTEEKNGKTENVYTVEWTKQNIKPVDPKTGYGWHGAVLVKAKEDLLGGNFIDTNDGDASIEAQGFHNTEDADIISLKNDYQEKIDIETPRVNVNELPITNNSTDWTVYLGEEVDPKDELINLYEKIIVRQVITGGTNTNGDDFLDRVGNGKMLYPLPNDVRNADNDQRESEITTTDPVTTFAFKDLLKDLRVHSDEAEWKEYIDENGSITEEGWEYLIAESVKPFTPENPGDPQNIGIVIPYRVYGNDDDSVLRITLIKEVADGEIDKDSDDSTYLDEHITKVVGEGVEKYTLRILYLPDKTVLPDDLGGNTIEDYHVGKFGSMREGRTTGNEMRDNVHTINVFSKPLDILKVDKDNAAITEKTATFELLRPWSEGDTDESKKVIFGTTPGYTGYKLDGADLSGTYYLVDTQDTDTDTGIAHFGTGTDAAKLLSSAKDPYIIIEKAAPAGYAKDVNVKTIIIVTDGTNMNLYSDLNNAAINNADYPSTGNPYNWNQAVQFQVKEYNETSNENQTSVIDYVNKDSGAKIILSQPVYTAGEPWKATGSARNPIYVFSNIENTKEMIRDDEDGVGVFRFSVINEPGGIDIIIHKVDDKGVALSGATFKLMNGSQIVTVSSAGDGVVIEPKVTGETVTITDNTFTIPAGGVTIKNLQTSDTEYAIVEVDSPDGYVITNDTPVKFKVTSGELTDKTMTTGVEYVSEGNEFTIPNTPGAALPNTGGPGIALIYLLGIMLTGLASAVLVMRWKRKAA